MFCFQCDISHLTELCIRKENTYTPEYGFITLDETEVPALYFRVSALCTEDITTETKESLCNFQEGKLCFSDFRTIEEM